MKALGKILGLLFLGLLLIIVALGFALTHLFDPNDYKDEIRRLAHDKANLELTLNGEIGWSLFPWLGLELHDTTVASAATPGKPFAEARLLGLSVRVMPLLRKQVQMSDIRVEGLNLTLQRDEQGRGNWQDIGRPAAPAAERPPEPAPAAPEPPAEPTPARPLKLDIDSLTVTDARLDYHDAASGRRYSLESAQLSTGAIREGASIPLKFTAFFGTNQPVLRAKTELSGNLRFDRVLKRYQLEDARFGGEASGEPLSGKTVTFSAQGQLLLDQAAQVAEWNGLKLSANQLRLLGELKVRELDKTPKLEGGLSIAALDLRAFLDGIGIQPPPMADPKTLSHLELAGRLSGSPDALALEDLNLRLDDSRFRGRVALADVDRKALRVQLKGDRLDLDRYLPPKDKSDDGASASRRNQVQASVAEAGVAGTTPLPDSPSQQAWSEAPLLPLERLRKLDLEAKLDVGQLTLRRTPLENVALDLTAKAGLLTFGTLRGDLWNGGFELKGALDARPAVPALSAQPRLTNVPVEKLLHTGQPQPPVKGQLTLSGDFTSQGNSEKALIDALDGSAAFALNKGMLPDANLEQQLCQGIATLNRKPLSGEPRGRDTPFDELKGTLAVRHGVASNPDLKVRIPGLTVNGDGDLDLRVLGMDYRIGVIIEGDQREMPDPACQVNKRYVGLEWPLRCRGPLEMGAKACRLDKEGLGKIAAKVAGDKLNEKIEEKLGDKVSPELKDALKGLFKR